MTESFKELNKTLDAIKDVRIGVLGDFCLDVYWDLDDAKTELSVETSLKTRAVREERFTLGGAANVTMNLAALGVKQIYAIGCVGQDPYGAELIGQLTQAGIDTSQLLQRADWHTHLFIKPHMDGHEERRIDIGNYNMPSEDQGDALIQALSSVVSSLDGLIVNQQIIPGATIMSPSFRKKVIDFLRTKKDLPIVVDSRDHAADFKGFIVKMNDRELKANAEAEGIVSHLDVPNLAPQLAHAWESDLVITQGELETVAIVGGDSTLVPAMAELGGSIDTVGAGDTFVSGFSAALAAGSAIDMAVTLGNVASAVTIGKVGTTGVAQREEVLKIYNESWFVYHPDRADNITRAEMIPGTQIEAVRSRDRASPIKYAIFDHDGTISTLRQGWESVMEPMMVRSILGSSAPTVAPELCARVEDRVREFIDRTTGVQTLARMAGLVELVLEFGVVPKSEILDPHGYKDLYNRALMEQIDDRTNKIARGEVSVGQHIVRGAVDFLGILSDLGITLFLASGTDQEDVAREADILGYRHVFNGGIFGAVGRVDVEAKREVIHNIIADTRVEKGTEILVVGDGPVEIREGNRAGAVTIGVASDEVRREGLNGRKRSRLIRAGADLVVPDFSECDMLITHLENTGVLRPTS